MLMKMSEKPNKSLSGAATTVPNKMRLYATWVDRTPSNCIPRLCTMTLTRLQILKPLGSDITTISIAVKIQSSKRTLRSNELTLPPNGYLDAPLDVTFCLQYPHFLKREGTKLHILLQRRKRYKNRTIMGYKTLAEGVIRMDQVLQKPMDLELELMPDSNAKDKVQGPCARLHIVQCSSNPVDQQDHKTDRDHDFRNNLFLSEDDDECSSGEEEAGDLSDSEPIRPKLPHTRHNLKQRFVSLLRRFRQADSEGGRGAGLDNPSDIQALFQELESLSCDEDSGGEQDTLSVSSTPKPSLRPFFSSSKSLLDKSDTIPFIENDKVLEEKTCSGSDGNADMCFTDPEQQSDPQTGSPPREQSASTRNKGGDNDFANIIMQELSEKKSKLFRSAGSAGKKKNSLSVGSDIVVPQPEITVRKSFADHLARLLPPEEIQLPEFITFVVASDNIVNMLCSRMKSHHKVFQPTSSVEVKAVLTVLFSKIHKYCNSCAKPNVVTKIILIGGDTLIGWFVRPYVEFLSSKPSEWLNYTRVFVVPVGACGVARHLATIDQGYMSLFPNESGDIKSDELAQRLIRYISVPQSAPLANLPISEAMLTCYDENSQLFIPFVNEVRVGPAETALSVSLDMEDGCCTSPPAPSLTPPSSPNVQVRDSPWEPLELTIEYWQMPKFTENLIKTEKDSKSKQDGKTSLKGLFRGLQASPTTNSGLSLTIHMASKEKKQKIMRLGKKKEKEKDIEPRSQTVEGISRLICSARASHTAPLKVYIDGVEFTGVKFFQLNSYWQTHVKNLTVSLVGVPLASTE